MDSTTSLVCVLSDIFTIQIFSSNQTLDSAYDPYCTDDVDLSRAFEVH